MVITRGKEVVEVERCWSKCISCSDRVNKSGDLIHSMMTIVDNIILSIENLLRE